MKVFRKSIVVALALSIGSCILVGCTTDKHEYWEVRNYRSGQGSGASHGSSKAEPGSPVNWGGSSVGNYGTQEPVRKPTTFSP